MQNKDSLPKPYHHGALKESALQEGLVHLGEVGVEKFSLREVARRLGVTPTALYHHFPDKEDLLKALAQVGLKEFQDLLFQIPQTLPQSEYLTALARSYIEFFLQRPYYLNLIFSHHYKVEGEFLENRQALFQFLQNVLIAQGVPQEQAIFTGLWLWASVHGLTTMFATGILGIKDKPCTDCGKEVFHRAPEDLLNEMLPNLQKIFQNNCQ